MNLRLKIIKDLSKIIEDISQELGLESLKAELVRTSNPEFGDYSTNIAIQLAFMQKMSLQQDKLGSNKIYQSPIEIARKIVIAIDKKDYIEKIEIAGPGFVNFFVKQLFWQKQVGEIVTQNEKYCENSNGKGKKARVEFVSANPTGPLHIGNARGGPLGDVIANVLEMNGYDVLREYLNNDSGIQVKELGKTLAVSAGLIEKDDQELTYTGEYTIDIAKKIKAKIGSVKGLLREEIIDRAGKIGVEILFKEIIEDVVAMGIKFDLLVDESKLQQKLPKILKDLESKGLLKKHQGALWFAPQDEFLKGKEAVVVKSDGSYNYFAADIVYHQEKFESGYDLVINVFGSNQHGHVPRLQAIVNALGYNVTKLKFILYQFVRVKRGREVVKMSKRAGNFVTAREVLDEVGKDAFRFFLLMRDPNTHMDFDLKLAKKKSTDNPVYYVQYAHARICSILGKAEKKYTNATNQKLNYSLLTTNYELDLIKQMTKLLELVEDLASSFAVHQLIFYVRETAELFHKFYENCKVISTDQKLTLARLQLVAACGIILRTSLKLLGIAAPEKM